MEKFNQHLGEYRQDEAQLPRSWLCVRVVVVVVSLRMGTKSIFL